MIVPAQRLLVLAAAILFPLSLAMSFEPALLLPGAGGILLLALLSFLDAQAAPARQNGWTLSFPTVLRLTRGRPAPLRATLHRPATAGTLPVRIGLALPPGLEPDHEIQTPPPEPDRESATIEWTLTASRRGKFGVEACAMETASPLGLWQFRSRHDVPCEIRVYPGLESEKKRFSALFLRRGGLGIRRERQIGQGREFEKLRDYIPGDAPGEIHWKTTAKRHEPVTKVFQVERTQEVYMVIDHSRLSRRVMPTVAPGQNALPALEHHLRASLVGMLTARQQGDLFGLLTFSANLTGFVPCRHGHGHFNICRDKLYCLEPRPESPDFEGLFSFIGSRIRRRSLFLIFTALDDPVLSEQLLRCLPIIRRRHLTSLHMLRPPGLASLFTDGPVADPNDLRQHLAGHLLWKQVEETRRKLSHMGVPLFLSRPGDLAIDAVNHYLSVKQRQAL